MRINPAFKIHKLGQHYMIVDRCADNSNLTNVYSLNEVAGELWLAMENQDFTIADLADWLCDNYEVDRSRAEADAAALVEKWRTYGLLLS